MDGYIVCVGWERTDTLQVRLEIYGSRNSREDADRLAARLPRGKVVTTLEELYDLGVFRRPARRPR